MPSSDPAANPFARTLAGARFDSDCRMCVVLEPSGAIRSISDLHGIEGWDVTTAIGQHIGDVSAGGAGCDDSRAKWDLRIASMAAATAPAHFTDVPPGQPAGAKRQVDTMLTPVRAADGALTAIVVHIQGEAGRAEADAVAREQHQQLTTALGLTGLGSYTFYLRETRMDTDARFDEIYALSPQALAEAEGIDGFWRVIHEDDRAGVQAALAAAMDGSVDYVASYRLTPDRAPGAELRYIEALGRVESDDEGPLRVVGVINDVTERRRAEDARLLTQKREAIGTLAGGIAHDFNNVIGAILSNAAVAEAEFKSGASPMTSLGEIRRGARRAGDVVKQLLSFGRDAQPRKEPFDLASIIEEAAALLQTALPEGVELRLAVDHDVPLVIGDASQLHQVVVNLVTNAGQAIGKQADPSGTVDVMVDLFERAWADRRTPPGNSTCIRLRVHDDGPGIPSDVMNQMFEPFFTTKPVGEGTGLGLTATQLIIRSHGGTIAADSEPGAGALFTVLLPAATTARTAPPGAPARQGSGKPIVLVVDDESALAHLAERAMPLSGCLAVAFDDPTKALDAFRATPHAFDAVVTDLSMPGMSGLELINAILTIRPGMPAVLSSGFITADTATQARALGVGRMVPKPCAVADLATAVHELLAEQAGAAGLTAAQLPRLS